MTKLSNKFRGIYISVDHESNKFIPNLNPPEPNLCVAITSKNHACKNKVIPGFDNCVTHIHKQIFSQNSIVLGEGMLVGIRGQLVLNQLEFDYHLVDLYSFLEAICLFDKIYIHFGMQEYGIIFSEIPEKLLEKDFIIHLPLDVVDKKIINCQKKNIPLLRRLVILKKNWGEYTQKFGREIDHLAYYLDIEDLFDLPYLPSSSDLTNKFYLMQLNKSLSFYNLLFKTYKYFSSEEQESLGNLLLEARRREITIPPIPAIIFDRCTSPKEILNEAFALREELEPLRKRYNEYLEIIRNPSIPLRQWDKEAKKITKSFNVFLKKYNQIDIVNHRVVLDGTDGISKLSKDTADYPEIPLTKKGFIDLIAKYSIEKIADYLRSRRISQLFNIRDIYYNLPNHMILINKLWPGDSKIQMKGYFHRY